jgi:hypothetical protein
MTASMESTHDRLIALYQRTLARTPDEQELRMASDFLETAKESSDSQKIDPWSQLAQVLLLSNEFAFVD